MQPVQNQPVLTAAPGTPRDAARARAWRLAVLLTADPARATALVLELFRRTPGPETLETPLLDRAVIQAARATAPSTAAPPPFHALAALPAQGREAFVLADVDALDELWLARAMDCSKTAARVHLDSAHRALIAAGHEPARLAAELRAALDALPALGEITRAEAARRTSLRRRATVAAVALFFVLSLALLAYLTSR